MKSKQTIELSDVAGVYLISGITMLVISMASIIATSYCTVSVDDIMGAIGVMGGVFVCIGILKNRQII